MKTKNVKHRSCARCGIDLSARMVEGKNPLTGKDMMVKRRPPTVSMSLESVGYGSPQFIHFEWCSECAGKVLIDEKGQEPFAAFWRMVALKAHEDKS